ncbi:MAG: hypothetical protein AAB429_01450 [Patescibacteria group bacterium]
MTDIILLIIASPIALPLGLLVGLVHLFSLFGLLWNLGLFTLWFD